MKSWLQSYLGSICGIYGSYVQIAIETRRRNKNPAEYDGSNETDSIQVEFQKVYAWKKDQEYEPEA